MLTSSVPAAGRPRQATLALSRQGSVGTRLHSVQHTSREDSLRLPLLGFIFCALAIDSPGENALGKWESPLAAVGGLLTENLNKTVPIPALSFPLSALILIAMAALCLPRLVASVSSKNPRPVMAPPLIWALALALGGVAVLVVFGALNGGDIQMAKNQVQNYILLLLTAGVVGATLAGPADYRLLGRLVVAAACVKALMAIWVDQMVLPDNLKALYSHFATVHGDSLLFGGALVIIAALWIEDPRAWRHPLAWVTVPLIIAGMVANNRRLAWVEVAAALALISVVGPRRLRRALARSALVGAVPATAYVAAGWNSTASWFAPVRFFRSIQDNEVDSSTLFRDIENYNLLQTVRSHPLLGKGFGHPFDEVVKNFDISFFKEYYFLPHNSVLGVWSFGGVLGFTALSAVIVIAVYCAARSYRCARTLHQRVAALAVLGMLLMYEIHCWGDIGFNEKRTILLVGPALAIAGQLAVATGAWRRRNPAAGHLHR